MERYFCPVCGQALEIPAWKNAEPSFEICPSCGVQFGYTDMAGRDIKKRRALYKEMKIAWLENKKLKLSKQQVNKLIDKVMNAD